MQLLDVYSAPESVRVLYDLLKEREPYQKISHKNMPSFDAHSSFVASRPYLAWYLIVDDGRSGEQAPVTVGAVYLSKQREVGLFVFKKHQGRGFGRQALDELILRHPGMFLANIAPGNDRSQRFFAARGFRHIQNTYELP